MWEKKSRNTGHPFWHKKYLNSDREHVTSQEVIGFDKMFREYIVKDWHGDNENCESCNECNKIIVKKSIEFCNKFWDNRNSCMNQSEFKRKMVMDWHEKAKQEALNSEYPQAVKYVRDCDENIEKLSMEYTQSGYIR